GRPARSAHPCPGFPAGPVVSAVFADALFHPDAGPVPAQRRCVRGPQSGSRRGHALMGSLPAILRRGIVLWGCAAAATLSGCGPARLTVKPQIPPLLMTPLPMAMGVRIPKTFAEYVQK